MDQPIRLLVCDVDGTLVRLDKSLAPATVEAAGRLLHAGVRMTLISARPPSGILPLAKALGLTDPLGAFNGGTLVEPSGHILSAHRLSVSAGRAALGLLAGRGVTVWVFADCQWYASDDSNPHSDRERLSSMVEPVVTRNFDPLLGRIDKIVAVTDDHGQIVALEADLQALLGGEAEVSRSQTYYCDITHPRANKGDGITALAEAIGVPLEETAAIGDMANDIPMLRRAGLGIAMGQAPEPVKAAAGWVSLSNEEDGVAHAIAHRLLPEIARHRL